MITVEIRKERLRTKKRLSRAVYNAGFTIKAVSRLIPFHYQSVRRLLDEKDPFWSQRIVDAIDNLLYEQNL